MGEDEGPPAYSGRDAAAIFDEEAGFEICRKEGIEAVVLGSFVKAGETFATDVQVLDASSKHILKSASAKGEGVASILNSQIDEISRTIRRGIALPAFKIETPAERSSTSPRAPWRPTVII